MSRCDKHAAVFAAREAARKAEYETRRPPRRPRAVEVWDPRWRELRAAHLAANPWCVGFGERAGRCGEKASHVDHVVPERVAPERVLDPTNLQSLCHSCHSTKTASRDGGYGRPQK